MAGASWRTAWPRRRAVGVAVVAALLLVLAAVTGDLGTGLGAGNRMRTSHLDLVTVAVRPPVLPPGPPTKVTVVPGNRSLVVSWHPPLDEGGAPVTEYEAVTQPRLGSCTTVAPVTSCTISGLNNGQFFTVTVRAFNAAGPGEPSAPSAPVRPRPG